MQTDIYYLASDIHTKTAREKEITTRNLKNPYTDVKNTIKDQVTRKNQVSKESKYRPVRNLLHISYKHRNKRTQNKISAHIDAVK